MAAQRNVLMNHFNLSFSGIAAHLASTRIVASRRSATQRNDL